MINVPLLIGVTIYLLAMLYIGFYLKGRIKNIKDYLIAGRNLGTTMFAATMVASVIGATNLMGVAGFAYFAGIGVTWFNIAAIIGGVAFAFLGVGRLRTMSEEEDWLTAPDFYEHYFGPAARLASLIPSVVGYSGMFGAQLLGIGIWMELLLGVPYLAGLLFGAAVIAIYVMMSGFWGVVISDTIQYVIMVVGIFIAVIALFGHGGGVAPALANIPADKWNMMAMGPQRIIGLVVGLFFATWTGQNHWLRYYAAKSTKVARNGVLLAMCVFIIPLVILPPLVGMLGITEIPNLTRPDMIFPIIVLEYLPFYLGVIVVSALIAGIMSNCDSYLLSVSGHVTRDVYHRFINQNAPDALLIKVARLSVFFLMGLGLLFGLLMEQILETAIFGSKIMSAGIVVPFLVAFFWPKMRSSYGAVLAMIFGAIGTIIWHVIGNPYVDSVVFGMLLSLVGMVLGTIYFKMSPPKGPKTQYWFMGTHDKRLLQTGNNPVNIMPVSLKERLLFAVYIFQSTFVPIKSTQK